MTNAITLENCKSYVSEKNLDAALSKLGLDDYCSDGGFACRYIKCCNGQGRWTAVFLVSEYFRANNTGGYIGFASQFGFMSI